MDYYWKDTLKRTQTANTQLKVLWELVEHPLFYGLCYQDGKYIIEVADQLFTSEFLDDVLAQAADALEKEGTQ